jgi:hypothetical protein
MYKILSLKLQDFNPEKYYVLGKLLSSIYAAHGDPLKLLEGYIKVGTVLTPRK